MTREIHDTIKIALDEIGKQKDAQEMTMIFNEPIVTEEKSYYVIALTLRGERTAPNPENPKKYKVEYYDLPVFFKADRYSPYSGRLQTEHDASDARSWKTSEGATKALSRLIRSGTIKDQHRAVVCRYTRTVTLRFDVIETAGLSELAV